LFANPQSMNVAQYLDLIYRLKQNAEFDQIQDISILDVAATAYDILLEHEKKLSLFEHTLKSVRPQITDLVQTKEDIERFVERVKQNLPFADFKTYFAISEFVRQILSTGVLTTPYKPRDPRFEPFDNKLASIGNWAALGIHNHVNYKAMPGLGWFTANANGFIFRTRHNDYRLYTKDTGFLNVKEAPMPPKLNLSISEMQDLFRRYVNKQLKAEEKIYFQWWLAYAEVFFYILDEIYEPLSDLFESFRHGFATMNIAYITNLAAQEAFSGKYARFENSVYFPAVFKLDDGRIAVLVYRILVEHIPQFDGKTWDEIVQYWDWYQTDETSYTSAKTRFMWKDGIILEQIWQLVPGLDGRGATLDTVRLTDNYSAFGKNYAYYHRFYTIGTDATNTRTRVEGWNDVMLITAHTTQTDKVLFGTSWIIPLELILRTPLETWNPYNIPYRAKVSGSGTEADPYDGYNENSAYFLTPAEFFEGITAESTQADTTRVAWVKDSKGVPRLMVGSGIWIVLPPIPGIGSLRTRYPIYVEAYEQGLFGYYANAVKKQLEYVSMDSVTLLHEQVMKLTKEVELIRVSLSDVQIPKQIYEEQPEETEQEFVIGLPLNNTDLAYAILSEGLGKEPFFVINTYDAVGKLVKTEIFVDRTRQAIVSSTNYAYDANKRVIAYGTNFYRLGPYSSTAYTRADIAYPTDTSQEWDIKANIRVHPTRLGVSALDATVAGLLKHLPADVKLSIIVTNTQQIIRAINKITGKTELTVTHTFDPETKQILSTQASGILYYDTSTYDVNVRYVYDAQGRISQIIASSTIAPKSSVLYVSQQDLMLWSLAGFYPMNYTIRFSYTNTVKPTEIVFDVNGNVYIQRPVYDRAGRLVQVSVQGPTWQRTVSYTYTNTGVINTIECV